ncbi:MAG TPA: hypothetical protein VIY47_14930 [Ignavibacteriaceae bacterium]
MPTDAERIVTEIKIIKDKRPSVIELDGIMEYVLLHPNITITDAKNYIRDKMPTKMGGRYIEVASTLSWLIQRLKITPK